MTTWEIHGQIRSCSGWSDVPTSLWKLGWKHFPTAAGTGLSKAWPESASQCPPCGFVWTWGKTIAEAVHLFHFQGDHDDQAWNSKNCRSFRHGPWAFFHQFSPPGCSLGCSEACTYAPHLWWHSPVPPNLPAIPGIPSHCPLSTMSTMIWGYPPILGNLQIGSSVLEVQVPRCILIILVRWRPMATHIFPIRHEIRWTLYDSPCTIWQSVTWQARKST